MNRLITRGMVAVAGAMCLSASTLAVTLYEATPLNSANWRDEAITSLADDTQLAVAGPVTLTGATIGFYGNYAFSEGITATVNFYNRVGLATGAWTRGSTLLGTSGPQQIVNGAGGFFDVFFNLNQALTNGDIITEVLFDRNVGGGRGIAINQNAVVGYSNDHRIQEDGVYWDFAAFNVPRSNMRVILHGDAVPEPFTMGLGLAAAGVFVRRRMKKA